MGLQMMLRKFEAEFGRELVREQLEVVAFDWDAPHVPEPCLYCRIDPVSGDWDYCERSVHHPSHPRHQCTLVQACACED